MFRYVGPSPFSQLKSADRGLEIRSILQNPCKFHCSREMPRVDFANQTQNLPLVRRALELAGVEFIDENGGGAEVRLRKRPRAKPSALDGAFLFV